MIKRIVLTCITLLLLTSGIKASHLMGGEITWKCLPNGQFRFFMKVYRDCGGITFGTTGITLDVHNYPGLTSINMNLLLDSDISPKCNHFSGNQITCTGNPASGSGAVEEFTFQSNPITLTGTPPAAGWIFSYSNCCRNTAIDNLSNAGSDGFSLRAIMYPYNGLNTNPCYDSSPYFVESPNTIICSGYPFTYNPTAVDPELDSLVYAWAKPLDSWASGAWSASNPAPLAFSPGYSYTSPMPGTAQNPLNIPATIDPSTGEINYTCYTSGVYVTVNKVSAYKCGQLVAEIFRDVQITLLQCPSMNPATPGVPAQPNNPPTVTVYDNIKQKYYVNPIVDTIYAGQVMDFFISGYDTDFDASLAVSEPASGGYQRLRLYAASGEFGTNFTSTTTGCQIAPCATLNPPSSPGPVSQFLTTATLHWQTSCAHLGYSSGCINFQNTYTFIIKVKDDFCPAPGITVNTIKIVLMAPPQLKAPVIRCTSVAANGNVTLNWTAPVDTFNSFNAYQIYHSTNLNGPYTLIDSLFNISTTSFTHVGAGANLAPQYYYIVTRDLCKANRYSAPSDTAASMFLTATNVGGTQAQLNWNPVTNPLLSSSTGKYKIYKEFPAGTWTLIDSTNALTYLDNVNILGCNDSMNYRIEKYDSTGCTSVSSIDGASFQNVTQPDPPDLRCLVANNNGTVTLSWVAPVDTGLSFDGYYIYSATNPAGPFTLIDSIFNYNLTSYPHLTANIMSNARYYYLKTFCKCGNVFSINSDTLQAIRLTVLNVAGVAQLSWNPLHFPLLPSSALKYYVYQENPPGTWTLIDSTANTSINITKTVCNDSINFRIEIADASGCVSKSTIDGKFFIDTSIPDPPELRCISVNANGSITLNWALPIDTGLAYNSYHLYYSTNAAGPFNEIDSMFNYNLNNYTHATANAYAGDVYYTIKTRTGCGVRYSVGSDTLRAIRLNVTNPLGGQIANLNWNAIHTPNLPSSSGLYKIYKKYSTGGWSFLASTPALSYLDTNAVCIDSINYRVEIADALTCNSVSTIDGATFIDNSIPDAPILRCVSVNPSGNITLSWSLPVDTGLDFNSYHIYSSLNPAGPFIEIDSNFTYATNSYTHAAANAYTNDFYYFIKTRTGCGVRYSFNSDTLRAIRLDVTNPLGGQIANLNWNAIHTPNLITSSGIYNIYKKYSTGGWSLLASTAALSYLDTNAVCLDSINYRVEIADASSCISVSIIDGATFIDNEVPDPPQLRCVSVNANGTTTLSWTLPVDTGMDFNSYHIYSSLNPAGPFIEIDSNFTYTTNNYTHAAANAYTNDFYYFVKTRTGCGVQYSVPSDTMRAIRLDVTNPLGGQIANLNWNAIHTPNLATSTGIYNIYKKYSTGAWSLLASTSALSYLDTNAVCIDSINYRVEIADASACISVSTIDGATFIDNRIPDAPELRCVSVNPNGSINLNWALPVDTGLDYNSYHIYSSTNISGPFTEIDSTFNYNQTSYSHLTANAYLGDIYYTLKTRTGCGVQYSVASDTLRAIRVDVTNPLGGQVANIKWNAMRIPSLPSSSGVYNVFKEYPTGVWNLIGSTSALSYTDSTVVCIDSINYHVEIADALVCNSVSTIDGATFIDNTIPASPELRCLDVNANGTVSLSWVLPVDTGLNFNSYHIYSSNNPAGPFTEVDSIFNYTIQGFTDPNSNAYAGSLFYNIKTRTGCGVEYSLPSDTLQAIVLDVTNPGGLNTATLNWNHLHTPELASSTGYFYIYEEYPAGTWTLIDSTFNTNYQKPLVLCYDSVHYRVSISNNLGCQSRSTFDGDLFVDNTIPDAPDLRCVAIDPTGKATVTWIAPVDTGLSFDSYHVFYSTSATGPFTEVDSIFNYNTLFYTHNAANGNNTNIYYYVETRTNCGVQYSLPSDTLHGIKLNVTNTGNGIANLQWNALHTPLLPSSDLNYKIYREYPAGTWAYLNQTPNLFYQDTINLCNAFINYRVEIADAIGCVSISSIDGDLFKDVTPPAVTLLDTVSVNPATGEVTVSWLPNTSNDVIGYIVYLFNGASWDSIGSTNNINALSYLYTASNANNVIEHYNIAAYDSCGNLAPLGNEHNSILLKDTLDKCNASIDLRWNSYKNMPGGLASYNIFMSENGSSFKLLANVSAANLTYIHENVKKDTTYCYFVQAVGMTGNRTASSNKVCTVADVLIMPDFTYIKRVTVENHDEVLIECYVDTAADISKYKLMRSGDNGVSYGLMQEQLFTGAPEISFTDYTPSTDSTSYYYKLIDVSTCNRDVQESNIGRTILLQTTPFENLINKLEWNAYEDWNGGVQKYDIYRYYNGVWTAAPIATVPANSRTYFDNVASFTDGTGEFCYLIEATEGSGNIYNYQMKSESNENCAVQQPHLYLPNAFTPGGTNPVFHPYMLYYLEDGYAMQVFNRWGQTVFTTHDTNLGWDGNFDGQPAPEGVYVYHVKVKGANGKTLEKRGTVTLIR